MTMWASVLYLASSVAILASPIVVIGAVRRARRAFAADPSPRHRAAKGLAYVAAGLLALAPVLGVVVLVSGFAAVAAADTSSKATELAKGISLLMNCGPFAVLGVVMLAGVAGWLARPRP